MANHKSAIKRIRQTARRYERNRGARSRLRSKLKDFSAALERSGEEGAGLLRPAISLVDKSVQKGILHRNKGNRIKSSLSRAVNRAKAT